MILQMAAEKIIRGVDGELICTMLVLSACKNLDLTPLLKHLFSALYDASHTDKFVYVSKKRQIRNFIISKMIQITEITNFNYLYPIGIAVFANCIYERVINS